MHPTVAVVFVNLLIVALAAGVLLVTQNPLALLSLLMLREIPMIPSKFDSMPGSQDDEEGGGGPMGFVTD